MTATISADTARRIQQRAHTIAAVEVGAVTARRYEEAIRRDYALRTIDPVTFHERTGTWLSYLDRAAFAILGPGAKGYMNAVLDLYAR